MVIEKNKIACPACEYERNSYGQPVEQNGQMKCLDCGSSWRVFGTSSAASSVTVQPRLHVPAVTAPAENTSFKKTDYSQLLKTNVDQNKFDLGSYKFGLGSLMSCFAALLLFGGMYVGMLYLETDLPTAPADALNITEVEIEEQVRRNGEKVFTVKGLVSNPTEISKTIPPVAIILRKQNGSEITRWYYNSSLAALRAGGKSRFASSIQYDTPIVAYAEAVFK